MLLLLIIKLHRKPNYNNNDCFVSLAKKFCYIFLIMRLLVGLEIQNLLYLVPL